MIKSEISVWDFGSESILERSSPEWEHIFYISQQVENKLESSVRWGLPKVRYTEIQPRDSIQPVLTMFCEHVLI